MHSSGVAKVPFEELPKNIQQEYGYDPAKAESFIQQRANAQNREAKYHEMLKVIEQDAFLAQGTIMQVLDDGFLLSNVHAPSTKRVIFWDGVKTAEGHTTSQFAALNESYNPIFVVGHSGGMVDGQSWNGYVYPAGTYVYVTVNKGRKTVRRYATTVGKAVDLVK